ncbi:MAG TPA: translation initiation factor IF-2 [Cytophagaceae bacterium]|jgi:translation initiation factor IF-2|nr:translation initiation factor IF-2 [Cytophagaceae bacterium]
MAEDKMMRLSLVQKKLNVGISTMTEFLATKGFEVESNPNAKITTDAFNLLLKEFESSALEKKEASSLNIGKKHSDQHVVIDAEKPSAKKETEEEQEILIKNNYITEEKEVAVNTSKEQTAAEVFKEKKEEETDTVGKVKLPGVTVLGKIDLTPAKKPTVKTKKEEIQVKKEEVSVKKEEATPTEILAKETEVGAAKSEKKEKEASIEKTVEAKENVTHTEALEEQEPEEVIEAKADALKGLTVLGKISLPDAKAKGKKPTPVASSDDANAKNKAKKKRKRIQTPGSPSNGASPQQGQSNAQPGARPPHVAGQPKPPGAAGRGQGAANQGRGPGSHTPRPGEPKQPLTEKDIQDKIKATMAKLSGSKASPVSRSKYRKEKRNAASDANDDRLLQEQEDAKTLKVTEFISANDLASLMDVSVTQIISTCMSLGMFVSINQRLDAEAITIIADEFGYGVQFLTAGEENEEEVETQEDPAKLQPRAPIVTIMGHVDHGKTSLLDYIRKSKVVQGEAGGITQHIGAYDVMTDSGKRITFLDTPGHEAFTAMRARGAKITDVVIIVVAADDSVMPQTKEAINHAKIAGVPIVIAINKIDKPAANPDKIKEELSKENVLVEDWGGKYQVELISAKSGKGIPELLEKVLLEAEILDLKANPDKNAVGTIIEASLDKGRGYVTTLMVQSGTLEVGDVLLAGPYFGKVKAMLDHRGQRVQKATPSTPVQVLGLPGAPQAGEKCQVMDTEREAREIATKREQLVREQTIRTKKHITLDEIGRRLAIGNFKELNVIVKGDFDGSVEALSDSLLKLSTEEIQVRIIHKGVGQISESDVLLASASDAIVIAFQVRPSVGARKLAEQEQIEIRMYSIIYNAINDVKDAMEGMLEPKVEEVILGNIEVREVFKITKVGTVAGCYVTDGHVKRNSSVRLIRDGIVVHTGAIDALKRFKDDVAEVKSGYECGLSLKKFNDIEVGDTIEAYETKEVKRSL